MLNRTNMQIIEAEFGLTGPNMTRMEGMARGTLLLLQLLMAALVMPAQLWSAGVGAAVMHAPEDGKPAGSQYTRRWWLALQMALAVFTVAMKTPVSVLAELEAEDGSRPFAVFDPALVAGEFQSLSLERLVYTEPETVVLVTEEPGEPA